MTEEDDYTISEEQRLGMLEVEKYVPVSSLHSASIQEDTDDDDDSDEYYVVTPPPYDVAFKLETANRLLFEDTTPIDLERERKVKFSENLVEFNNSTDLEGVSSDDGYEESLDGTNSDEGVIAANENKGKDVCEKDIPGSETEANSTKNYDVATASENAVIVNAEELDGSIVDSENNNNVNEQYSLEVQEYKDIISVHISSENNNNSDSSDYNDRENDSDLTQSFTENIVRHSVDSSKNSASAHKTIISNNSHDDLCSDKVLNESETILVNECSVNSNPDHSKRVSSSKNSLFESETVSDKSSGTHGSVPNKHSKELGKVNEKNKKITPVKNNRIIPHDASKSKAALTKNVKKDLPNKAINCNQPKKAGESPKDIKRPPEIKRFNLSSPRKTLRKRNAQVQPLNSTKGNLTSKAFPANANFKAKANSAEELSVTNIKQRNVPSKSVLVQSENSNTPSYRAQINEKCKSVRSASTERCKSSTSINTNNFLSSRKLASFNSKSKDESDLNAQIKSNVSNIKFSRWNLIQLPQYEGQHSMYGLSAEQLEERKRLSALHAQKRKEDKERKTQEEEQKKKENEMVFRAWLESKRTAASHKGKESDENVSTSYLQERKENSQKAYKSWLERKSCEFRRQKQLTEMEKRERQALFQQRVKEQSEIAFKQWLKRKNAEDKRKSKWRKQMKFSQGRPLKNMLCKLNPHLRGTYMIYLGIKS